MPEEEGLDILKNNPHETWILILIIHCAGKLMKPAKLVVEKLANGIIELNH